jgi:hypothetical protein
MIAQIVLVALLTTVLELTTDAFRFRSPANALWLIALPAVLGVALNKGMARKALMAGTLIVVALATGMVVGVNFTSYG